MNGNNNAARNGRLIVKLLVLASLLLGIISSAHAATIQLQWNANSEPNLAGYRVYYGVGSLNSPTVVPVAKQFTTVTIANLDAVNSYQFAVTAYNTSGEESSYSDVVVAELQDPTATITIPANGATVTGAVNFTAAASDNVGVTKVEYFLNNSLIATDTGTPYIYSWDTQAAAPGSYTLLVKAYDAAGNVGQSSPVMVTVANDPTPPTVSLSAPVNGATVSGTVNVSANATDNINVNMVEIYVNGAMRAVVNSAPFSYSWNTTLESNGSYLLTAKAYDAANNVATSSAVAVTVNNVVPDTTAPSVAITAPATSTTVSGTVNVTASATDNVGVSKVEFFVNGSQVATDSSSPYSFSWNSTAVANGAYIITAKAYDVTNNAATSSAVIVTVNNIVPDTTAPSVAVTAPATSTTVSGTVNVTASATDNVGVSKVEFFVNGSLVATDSSSPYSFSWNTTAVANGSYNLTAKAYDITDNAATSSEVTVTVNNTVADTTAPSVAITAPATGTTVSGTVNVTASATDNVGVSKVEFFVNGALVATDSSSPYSFSWNTTTVANGSYNLTARAYDAVNNATISSAVSVSVNNIPADTTAPVVTLVSVPNMTAATSLQLSGSVSDNVGVSAVTVKVGLQTAVTATIVNNTWSCSVSGLVVGTNTVVVTATDAKGNAATASAAIKVYRRGDITGDGVVDILDAQKAQKIAVGKQKATAEQLLRGDVAPLVNSAPEPNGVIDTGDVIVIQNIAIGNIVL